MFSPLIFLPFLIPFVVSVYYNDIQIDLQKVDVLERLGLADVNDTQGAAFDGRLEAILALGTKVYTARLGVGTPPQPVDFLLNWVGDLISPGFGDLSFVLSPKALDPNATAFLGGEVNATMTFNSSASKSFTPRPDLLLQTTIQPDPMNFTISGQFGDDVIMFNESNLNVTIRQRQLGQVEKIEESELFDKLSVGGMLSLNMAGPLFDYIAHQFVLAYGKRQNKMAKLLLGNGKNLEEFCHTSSNLFDMVKWFGNETGIAKDTMRMKFKGIHMQVPETYFYSDKERVAILDPNSAFLRGPHEIVANLASTANATKTRVGRHEMYTIGCDQPFDYIQFNTINNSNLRMEKNDMKMELPGNLLPSGQCLWALQELQIAGEDVWIFGRPIFEKYCLIVDAWTERVRFHLLKED